MLTKNSYSDYQLFNGVSSFSVAEYFPQVAVNFPQVAEVSAQVAVNFPQVVKLFPQVAEVSAQVAVNFPQVAKLFPQVAVNFPQAAKLFPQVAEASATYGAMYMSYGINVFLFVAVWAAYSFLLPDANVGWTIGTIGVLSIILFPIIFRTSRLLWINMFVKYDSKYSTKPESL